MCRFLIESPNRNRKVLYDLAFMGDLVNRMPPVMKAMFTSDDMFGIDEFQHIPDAIKAHGIELSRIDSIIWSHAHIDHTGDPSVFPPSTELVVGPGLKEDFNPGYPINPNSYVFNSAFEGRSVREIDFSNCATTMGGFRAMDFFEDGSLWILETPGHTSHHISALCRTTDSSWLLLGGDAFHNIAQLRPSPFRPLPHNVNDFALDRIPKKSCSCEHEPQVPPKLGQNSFYDPAPRNAEDLAKAKETIEKLKVFDGRDDVMIVAAHDATLLDVLAFFPQNINDWKVKDLANKGRWLFLKDF
ncbi:hypothetical protein NHQ30_003504 [Ciborinia camelliae]|nr:hypothetical protein NHQ30_003504 [Ciborinia camelliae]